MERSKRDWLCLILACAVALPAVTTIPGCVGPLTTAAWLIKGNDVNAEYNGLKHKRVAVICRPLEGLQYTAGGRTPQDLAAQVGRLLQKRVRGITIIDQREIAKWTDEHDWDDYIEVGKQLKADMVVGISLEEYGLYQSQTLYQGKARLNIKIYDVAEGGESVWHKSIPRIAYPPNRGVDTAMPEEDFRQRFVQHLADVIGRHFYSHDAQADLALDAEPFSSD
ncbi:MAG TPA: hypothetical protein VGJ26_17155 [Pirellulales bacterium]|jgi:hypothetical protein